MRNVIAATIKAVQARFIAETRQLEIVFNNGAEYRWPVDALEMLVFRDGEWSSLSPRPSDDQLKDVEIWPDGEIVEFSQISQGYEIAELVRGKLGSEAWTQALIAKKESAP